MTDRDPTRLDYGTFPPAMLMGVSAVAVRLHDKLDHDAADTWRKTLEVFATSLRLQAEWLPVQGTAACLHLSGPAGVHLRCKAMVLNWLSLSRAVHSLRVLAPAHRRAPGLTLFIGRQTTLLLAP